MSSKKWILAAVALTATLGAGLAQAHGRDNVQWSVTIGTPVYSQPVYGQPVYGQPVYDTAPVFVEPSYGYSYGRGYRQPTRWDRDGDGIPNRYDRVYNPRWDRDGDGIPNRYDRHDNRSHEGYGYDRYDNRSHEGRGSERGRWGR
jgi:hypothetical protein